MALEPAAVKIPGLMKKVDEGGIWDQQRIVDEYLN